MIATLSQLQAAITQRLLASPALSAQTVLTRAQSDLEARINEAIHRGRGLCLVVGHPLPERIVPDAPGPIAETLSVPIDLYENVALRTDTLTLLDAAGAASARLHLWVPPLEGWSEPLRLSERRPWNELRERAHPNRLGLRIELNVRGPAGSPVSTF
ncbi:MAG: hypothetical protein ACFB20_12715 [Opitutales bacterium]